MPAMTPDELKTHLGTLSWSQAELARRLGVAPNTVYRWAAGLLEVPVWLSGYLDMATTVCRCVRGQAGLTDTGVPLAVYELADRIGVAYPSQFGVRQREYEERKSRHSSKQTRLAP